MTNTAKLIFFCGKMASGKSTLAGQLAKNENALLLVQDEFLNKLFPGKITDVAAFVEYSNRLRAVLGPHICALLLRNVSVVLDFPGNTKAQRSWFRELLERTNANHELHYLNVPDALCKRQLKDRSRHLAAGTAWTSEEEFEAITAYFQPPTDDENFNIIQHDRF